MFRTWVATVLRLIASTSETSLFVRPMASRRRTSTSRAVRSSGKVTLPSLACNKASISATRRVIPSRRAKHQVSPVQTVPAYGEASPRDEPIENSACLGEHPYLGANEHQTGLPYAPGCAGGNFLYLWC